MDGRCKDCKWWSPGTTCSSTPEGWGSCRLITIPDRGAGAIPYTAMALVCTDDDAGLDTAPDFGCVHWEAKVN